MTIVLQLKFLWRDLIILFLIAFFVHLLVAWPQQQPNYMDAAYSYVNALNLAEGRGFVEDFVWNYLDDPAPPPKPSHLYWMPLTSIFAWLGMLIAGESYRAAQILFIILSAVLAPLTYSVAHLLSGQRWQSWLAGLLMIFSGFYFPFWTAIDNFTPFALAGSLALLLAWLGMEIRDWRPVLSEVEGLEIGGRVNLSDKRELTVEAKRQPAKNQEPRIKDKQKLPIITSHLLRSSAPLLLTSGVFIGLAHLARADGPLLLITISLFYLLYNLYNIYRLRITYYALRITFCVSRFIALLLVGYLLIITPWLIRNWQATGTPFPSAGTQTIWLTTGRDLFSSYHGLFSYSQTLSAQTFFAQDLEAILRGRWWALTTNLQTVLAAWCMIFLLPLVLIGGWHLRRHSLVQLTGLYGLLLFCVMTLVFAFPGALGGLFHSGAALLPFIYAVAAVGLDRGIEWGAARRHHWNVRVAKRTFAGGVVALAIFMSGFIYYGRVLRNNVWNNADNLYPSIAAWIKAQDADAVVMINNPPAYRYHGGGLSVAIPAENVDTTLQVARRYQVDYLVLESNHPAALTDLYEREATHPNLSLIKTFAEGSDHEVYIYEILRP